MNISKTQQLIKENEISQQLLQDGIEPNTFEISNRLSDFFDTNIPGLPYYKPLKIGSHETSDPNMWNNMFKSIGIDLNVIYKANVDQNNKIMTMEEYYLSEKDKVSATLDKLQLRLTNLQESISSGKVVKNYCQTFDNFYNIEFDGNVSRNIPCTNTFVDLIQKKIYNDKLSNAKDKKDISNSFIKIKPISKGSCESVGDISSILKDTINEIYTYMLTSDVNSNTSIQLDVSLLSTVQISCIVLTITSSNIVSGILSISEDGEYYTDLYTVKHESIMEWIFDSTAVKYLRIVLTKQEADGYNGSNFEYYYIIKNLSLTNETFLSKSSYVSKPISIEGAIETITLNSSDLIFPNTNINYFIGIDNDVDKVNWQFIENGVPCNMNLLEEESEVINEGVSNVLNHYGDPVANDCYRLCKIPKYLNDNSVQLKSGYQMWYVESLMLWNKSKPNINLPSTYQLNLEDYKKELIIPEGKGVIDNEAYDLLFKTGHMHIMTQYVFCKEDCVINSKYIKQVRQPIVFDGVLQCKVFVNNKEVNCASKKFTPNADSTEGTTYPMFKYNVGLKAGRNKVQIVLFTTAAPISFDGLYTRIEHNFNFKEKTSDIFITPQMKLIDINALRHKVEVGSNKFYAIDEENFVVVKSNPLTILSSIKPAEPLGDFEYCERKIRYLLKYKYLSPNVYNLVKMVNNTPNLKFRIMAILLSSEESVSPQILNYRIIGQ